MGLTSYSIYCCRIKSGNACLKLTTRKLTAKANSRPLLSVCPVVYLSGVMETGGPGAGISPTHPIALA